MSEPAANQPNRERTITADSDERVARDTYDPHIVPAETAAREEREGERFKTVPSTEQQAHTPTDEQTEADSIRKNDGYTVDQEGLINNYAIEPEMYINEPGDLREAEAEAAADRRETLEHLNDERQGELSMEGDERSQGPGAV